VPRRSHRRIQPWAEFDPSPKELAQQTRFFPVQQLARGLAYDDAFLGAIERVRTGRESVEQAARRYVWREGRPREVMRRIIERAAVCDSPYPQRRVLSIADTGVAVDAPLADDDPTEWSHAKRHREAAAMLTRLGSGCCLVCGDALASDGLRQRRRYCAAHQPQASIRERADREAILALLNSAADALHID
jgi:hypothetical protein